MINLMKSGQDDPDMVDIWDEIQDDCYEIYRACAEQEKSWIRYLMKDGNMIGLNAEILEQYLRFVTNSKMQAIGLTPMFDKQSNPIPWIMPHLGGDNVQVAPQETEISNYLVDNVDRSVSDEDLDALSGIL